jgi:hypothetical protein
MEDGGVVRVQNQGYQGAHRFYAKQMEHDGKVEIRPGRNRPGE